MWRKVEMVCRIILLAQEIADDTQTTESFSAVDEGPGQSSTQKLPGET